MPKKRKAGNRGPGGAGRAAKRAMESSRININTNAFRGALGVRSGAQGAQGGGAGGADADSKDAAMRGDFMDKVRRQRNKDEVYTMANVVLSAVTEVIEAGLVPLTPTAYFGALLKSLKSAQGASPALTAASVFLLSIAVREVPAPVLRENMSAVRAALSAVVSASVASAASVNKSTLRHVVEVYAVLLGAQDSHAWKNSAMHKFLHEFLFFTIHDHPKVRRKAQQCVQQLFEGKLYPAPRDGSEAPKGAPALTLNAIRHHSSGIVSKFCKVVFSSSAVDDSNKALYVLGWLKHVIHMLSPRAMKAVGELLVGVLREREGMHLHILILDCFEGLFMTTVRTDDADDAAAAATPSLKAAPKPLVLHVVTALLGMGVGADADKELVVAHTRATATGLVAAYELDAAWTYTKLPAYIGAVVQLFHSEDNLVLITATDAIKVLVDKCVDSTMVQQAAQARRAEVAMHATPLEAIVDHVESALALKYSASWGMVLVVVANMFEVLDSHAFPLCNSLLATAAALRDTHRFRFHEQLGAAIGAAAGAIGPERVLTVLPLQLDEVLAGTRPLSKSRAWLLPLLKKHVQGASLRFYATVLLPLAVQVRQRFEALQVKELHEIEAANLRMIHKQLWWLLPAFCDGAADIADAFDLLAPAIGHRISGKQTLANGQVVAYDPELRPVMVQALTHILVTARRHAEDNAKAPAVAACAKHAPQFLPIFFNTMGVTEGPTREALREALSQYALLLRDSPAAHHRQLVNAFFKNVLKTLLVASTGDDTPADESEEAAAAALAAQRARLASQHMLIDLASALVESLEDDAKDMLYRVIEPQLSDDDMVFQKKSYKVLERLLATSSTFVRAHFDAVLEMLLRVAPDCSLSARRARLRCLQSLVAAIEVDKLAAVPELLAEVITSVREANPRSRAIAYDVLLTLSGKFSATSHSPALQGGMESDLGEFFLMCMAGLAGTPHMITATVHALSRLVYHYRADVGDIQVQLLDSVLLFFDHKSREIVKAVFGFVKVCIVTLDADTLGPYLTRIIKGIFMWTEDARNRFRFRAKVVLERLIRKIGYDAVYDLVPPEHRRFLTNLRKTKEREARKKAELRAGGGKRKAAAAAAARPHQDFEDAMYGGDVTGVDTFRGGDDDANDDGAGDDVAFTERGEHAPDERWIKEGGSDMDDDVLDLLDGSAAGQAVMTAEERARVHKRRARAKRAAAREAAGGGGDGGDGDGMAVRADGFGLSREGKIVVPDDDEEEKVEAQLNTVRSHMRWLARMQKEGYGTHAARATDDGVDSDDEDAAMDGGDARRGAAGKEAAAARGSRKRKGAQSRGAELIEEYEGGGGKKKQRHDPGQFYGRQFKPKRGTGGDVRRKGQEQEPHAYMPLHPQQLSRRFQKKGMKRFDKLVNTSKRGQTLTKTQRRAKRAKGGRR